MASGNPPANTAIFNPLLQLHQRQLAAEYRPGIDVMLIIAVIALLQRRMAEPEMIRPINRTVSSGKMIAKTLAVPQYLLFTVQFGIVYLKRADTYAGFAHTLTPLIC